VGSDNAATLYRISVWDVRHEPNTPSIRNLFLIDVLLISGADKLHNTRAIVSDLKSVGQIVFERFSTKKMARFGTTRVWQIFSRHEKRQWQNQSGKPSRKYWD